MAGTGEKPDIFLDMAQRFDLNVLIQGGLVLSNRKSIYKISTRGPGQHKRKG